MSDSVYLLRSGEASGDPWDAELLTEQGHSQAISAGQELLRRGLGRSAYLLCSDKPRARQTARIIGETLDLDSEVVVSPQLRRGSENWGAVNHLGNFLIDSLRNDANTEAVLGRPFIAVVHRELISALKGVKLDRIEHGKIEEFPFDAGDPNYKDEVAYSSPLRRK